MITSFALHMHIIMPMHYVAKIEIEPFPPSGLPQLSKCGCAYAYDVTDYTVTVNFYVLECLLQR